MAFVLRRVLVSLLLPFVWKRWRNRPSAKQRRAGITTKPPVRTVT